MAGAMTGKSSSLNYTNWIKGGLGLNIVKDGIIPFVKDEVKTQHDDLIKNCFAPCTSCDLRTLQPDHTFQKAGNSKLCPLGMKKCLCLGKNQIPCPNNICGKLHDKIVKAHRFLDPNWNNTDIKKWFTDYWEVAKCFINAGGYAGKKPEETDCSGILSIVINNTTFPFAISTTKPLDEFSQMRNIRNDIMHSANLEIDEMNMKMYLAEMESLLGTISRLGNSFAHLNASAAAKKIKELEAAVMISSEDEKSLRMSMLKELVFEKEQTLQEIENKKQNITDITDKSVRDVKCKYGSAESGIDKSKQEDITSLQTRKGDIFKEFDKISEREAREIDVTSQQALNEIATQQTQSVSAIEDTTKERLNKTKSRLESIEKSLKSEQIEIKLLHDRTDAVEEEQKDMKEEIASLKSTVDEIDKTMDLHKDWLAYLKSKEDLRNDLCQYYKENFFHIPVTPVIKRPIGTIDDMFIELTETEPAFLETLTQEKIGNYGGFDFFTELDLKEHCVLDGNTYKSILTKKNKAYQNVVLTGERNSGKSTWCWNLLYKWVLACAKIGCNDRMGSISDRNDGENVLEGKGDDVREDELFLATFDIVLYVPLRSMSQYESVPGLIKNNTESPFFKNEERLAELELFLRSKHSKCLIVFDDLHKINGNKPIRNPVKEGLENCFYVSTSLAKKHHDSEFEVDQFDRYVSIEFVPHIRTLHVEFEFKVKRSIIREGNNSSDNAKQSEKCVLKDSTHLKFKNLTSFHFSDLPVFIVFLILNRHLTGQRERTLAINYASTIDFIIQLAENDKTGTLRKLENYDSYRHLWSDEKVKLPECFDHLLKLKKYAGLILKLAECTFQTQFGLGNVDLSADEEMLLYRLGMFIDKASDNETECQGYQSHGYSFDAFLAALHLVVYTQNTNDDRLLCVFEAHCDTYDKLRQKQRIIFFASGMDPKIASSLSLRLYQCLKSGEETKRFSRNPIEKCIDEIVCFSEGYPSVQYPIFATTVRLSGIHGRTLWECNYDKVTNVHLDSNEIQEQDVHLLKKSKNVRAIKWSIPHANMEEYKLEAVTNILPPLHLLTVLAINGEGLGWTPCCKKTQNIDLRGCIHIQHLSLEGISCRHIYVTDSNLESIFIDSICKCAIKIESAVKGTEQENYNETQVIYNRSQEPGKANEKGKPSMSSGRDKQNDATKLAETMQGSGATFEDPKREQNTTVIDIGEDKKERYRGVDIETPGKKIISADRNDASMNNTKQSLPETVSNKLIHIHCRRMNESKLEVHGRPKILLGVILKCCRNCDVVIKFPFQDFFSNTSESAVTSIRSVELYWCFYTRLIYYLDHCPEQTEKELKINIDRFECEGNKQSGLHSNISVNIKEVKLQALLDDLNAEVLQRSENEDDTPKIDRTVHIEDIPKLSNVTLIESLGQMPGLKRLICKNISRSLWELVGNVLLKINRLELLYIDNKNDLPVALFQNMKHIKYLTKLVVAGNCQGTGDEERMTNRRKAGLKELAKVLKDLHNVQYVEILNLEMWPKHSLSCLKRAAPVIHTIKCQPLSQNEVDTMCGVLHNVPKLNNLDLVCSVDNDLDEVFPCLSNLRELKHFSCFGISFEDSFQGNASQIDLSHIESFMADTQNSWNDIPFMIKYIQRMKNLTKLSLHAFLSEYSWTVLASSLPQLCHLGTVELTDVAGRVMPVAIIESLSAVSSLRKLTLNFQLHSEKEINTAVSNLNQLEVLELVYQTLAAYADLSGLLTGLSKLVNLQELAVIVRRYDRMNEPKKYTELADVLPCLKNISTLSLGHIVHTPSVLISLKHMANLRHLYLPGLEAEEWFSLGQSLPYLSKLESLETSFKEKAAPIPKYVMTYFQTGVLSYDDGDDDALTLLD